MCVRSHRSVRTSEQPNQDEKMQKKGVGRESSGKTHQLLLFHIISNGEAQLQDSVSFWSPGPFLTKTMCHFWARCAHARRCVCVCCRRRPRVGFRDGEGRRSVGRQSGAAVGIQGPDPGLPEEKLSSPTA